MRSKGLAAALVAVLLVGVATADVSVTVVKPTATYTQNNNTYPFLASGGAATFAVYPAGAGNYLVNYSHNQDDPNSFNRHFWAAADNPWNDYFTASNPYAGSVIVFTAAYQPMTNPYGPTYGPTVTVQYAVGG